MADGTREHGSHAANSENSYLTSTNKHDAGVRITRVGLYVNLGMAIAKGVGGYVFNSKALTADAIHSLTDLVSDVMTLATVSLAMKPPTDQFPSGYGKLESLGSLGVSGILLTGGFYMGWAAVIALCGQFIPGFESLAETLGLAGGHGHDHGHVDLGPNIHAIWLAGGSIVIKEWLYRATLKIANERKSQVLASNAYHHRVDSLTAFVALLMIGGSNILENAQWMDPIGGLVISLMVIQAGFGNTKSALYELADVGLAADVRSKVLKSARLGLAECAQHGYEVRGVQGVKAGQNYLVDVEVGAPSSQPLREAARVEDALRTAIGSRVRGVKRVRVRFVPADGDGDVSEFVSPSVSPRSSPEPSDDEHEHEHEHHPKSH